MWNIMYDGLLRLKLPDGVTIIGFADDVIIVATAESAELIEILVNDTIQRAEKWLQNNGLEMAAEKTEALLVTRKRNFRKPVFKVGQAEVHCQKSITYLGVELDGSLCFKPHLKKAASKAQATVAALSRIMPNVNGPSEIKRRVLMSVIHSQLLYAAPVWADSIKRSCSAMMKVESVQRRGALRITSAYRTVSKGAVLVLARVPPVDLLAVEREEIHRGKKEKTIGEAKWIARTSLLERWQKRWDEEKNGRWTHRLLPSISDWVNRKHGELNYHLTQALSGHGSFNAYLYKFKRKDSPKCDQCSNPKDDAEHTIFYCEAWRGQRQDLLKSLQDDLTPESMCRLMLQSKDKWQKIQNFIVNILSRKEENHRATVL